MTIIDSHCHLDFPDFAEDLDGVVERARAAGVERMITIGAKVSKAPGVVAIAERYHDVFFTVGTHPHEAAGEDAEDFDAMRAFARHPKCVGIGEAGLDYHYDSAPRDVAQRVFRGHIALARELDLPLVIHTRDADADMAAILTDEMGQGRFRALLHCFTASRELAETALDLGLMISFSGVVTFKKSEELRAIARDVPLDRILVETDAPYLAPTPHRGRRNEPAFVVATAGVVAEARGITPGSAGRGDARQHARSLWQTAPCRRQAAAGRRIVALTLRLTILGCGSSGGVPRIAEGWGACDPANPKNRRRRCSVLVERFGSQGATTVLVDTSPDLREQLLDADVEAARRRSFESSPRRSHAWHRRSEAALLGHAPPPVDMLYERADVAQSHRCILLYFSDA